MEAYYGKLLRMICKGSLGWICISIKKSMNGVHRYRK